MQPTASMTFHGAHAYVLGASSDIGMATALLLREAGLKLTLSAASKKGMLRLAAVFPEATKLELNLETIAADTATESDTALALFEGLEPPDYLVDCMQSDFEAFVAGADPVAAAHYLTTNISARAVCLREISRGMLAKRFGRCVFTSSTAASVPNAGQGYYAAAKQAGETLYRSLGAELAGRGVTTCSLRLGYVESGRGKRYLQQHPDVHDRIPAKRAITPDEAARTILFLLSDAATMINATNITMDGGLTACK